MEYLGTKMTKCVIRDPLKYLNETAESRHDRSSHILWYVSFHAFSKGRLSLLTCLFCLSCKIIKAV